MRWILKKDATVHRYIHWALTQNDHTTNYFYTLFLDACMRAAAAEAAAAAADINVCKSSCKPKQAISVSDHKIW